MLSQIDMIKSSLYLKMCFICLFMEIVEVNVLGSKFNNESRLQLYDTKDESNNPAKSPTFTYRELATATKNFRDDSFIGEGGFGVVYKGKLESIDQVKFF